MSTSPRRRRPRFEVSRKDFPEVVRDYLPTDRPADELLYWGLRLVRLAEALQREHAEELAALRVQAPPPAPQPQPAPVIPQPSRPDQEEALLREVEQKEARHVAVMEAIASGILPEWAINEPAAELSVEEQLQVYVTAEEVAGSYSQDHRITTAQKVMCGWLKKDNNEWTKKRPWTALPSINHVRSALQQAMVEKVPSVEETGRMETPSS